MRSRCPKGTLGTSPNTPLLPDALGLLCLRAHQVLSTLQEAMQKGTGLSYPVSRPSPDACVPCRMGTGQIPIHCVRSPMLRRALLHPRSASLASWLLGLAEELTSLALCSFGSWWLCLQQDVNALRQRAEITRHLERSIRDFFFPGDFSACVGFQKGFQKGNKTARLEDAVPSLLLLLMRHYRETLSVRQQLGPELPIPHTLALCCWDG